MADLDYFSAENLLCASHHVLNIARSISPPPGVKACRVCDASDATEGTVVGHMIMTIYSCHSRGTELDSEQSAPCTINFLQLSARRIGDGKSRLHGTFFVHEESQKSKPTQYDPYQDR